MYAKIEIKGTLEIKTGLHIGGSEAFAAIGAVDSPVMKDPKTRLPIIPGSSLKGKMRTLLAKEFNTVAVKKPDDDNERIARVFGTSAQKNAMRKNSRILVSDMIMSNKEELYNAGLESLTEVKFENTINRATAIANPRQIERVIRGSKFDLDVIYEVEEESEVLEDIEVIAEGFKLLQYDYLGGHGSRGYGKVKITDICANVVIGKLDDKLVNRCNEILNEAISK